MSSAIAKIEDMLGINLPKAKEWDFKFNLRRKLARDMSYNIWGQHINFFSNNKELEKLFSQFKIDNDLINVLSWNEYLLSLTGRSIVTINKTKGGGYRLTVPSIYFFQGMSKSFVTPQAAVIYQRVVLDDKLVVIKSTYTTTYCQNELWGMDNKKVYTFGTESKIWKDLQMLPYWEHNLGFVPVIEFMNTSRPFAFWLNTNWDELSDWSYGVGYENTIWEAIKNLQKELKMCHSRILVNDTQQAVVDTLKKGFEDEYDEDILGDLVINTGIGNTATAVPGVGDFAKYTKVILDMLDIYFKFCGSARFSEGGGAQKTVGEIGAQYKNKHELLEYKTTLRQEKLIELCYKFFRLMGIGEDEARNFTLHIKPNIAKDDYSYIETQSALLQNNIISPIDWIKDYYGCDDKQAQIIFEKNKKMNEEIQMQQMEQAHKFAHGIDGDGVHTNEKTGDRFS